MIRHILTIIWNERRSNTWILLEYILVFCVLWFCSDYLSGMMRTYRSDPGIDIRDTYMLRMGRIDTPEGEAEIDPYEAALTFLERVKRHPDVAHVTLGLYSIPYSGSISYTNMRPGGDNLPDSVDLSIRRRRVTSEFFDVFRITPRTGRFFHWPEESEMNVGVLSELNKGDVGLMARIPIDRIRTLTDPNPNATEKDSLLGTTGRIMDALYGNYTNTLYLPLRRDQVWLNRNEIALRVRPDTDGDFPQRFRSEMSEQLRIGPYCLTSVEPVQNFKARLAERMGLTGQMNGILAVTLFLMVNIFLGILGTFYFRTQSRRSEIGLRVALGASKRKVRSLLFTETFLLLLPAALIGTVLCLVLTQTELTESLGIPTIMRGNWGIGLEQDLLNFALTFAFMLLVSAFAVWYPARQAVNVQPAEALHEQ